MGLQISSAKLGNSHPKGVSKKTIMDMPRHYRSTAQATSLGNADESERIRGAHGAQAGEPALATRAGEVTSCVGFVDDLARLAQGAKRTFTGDEARGQLAAEVVNRFVPDATILGIRVRRWLAGRESIATRESGTLQPCGADGFRPSLIRGGQNEEVVRHVAAAAACVLARREYLVRFASLYDWVQGLFRGRAEAKAEIAGNNAGIRVGRALAGYLDGSLDNARLKAVLAAILCT